MKPLVGNARSKRHKTATKRDQLAMIAAVRAVVGVASYRFDDQQVVELYRYVCARGGDVGVLCDALTMIPRPSWVLSVPVK